MATNVIADYPAYLIYQPYEGRKFRHGEVIAIPYETRSHGRMFTFYTLGTVEGYAMQNGQCPHEQLAKHLAAAEKYGDGRVRYWANQNAVVLSRQMEAKKEIPGFEIGQTIILQGHTFTIEKAPNGNISLTEA